MRPRYWICQSFVTLLRVYHICKSFLRCMKSIHFHVTYGGKMLLWNMLESWIRHLFFFSLQLLWSPESVLIRKYFSLYWETAMLDKRSCNAEWDCVVIGFNRFLRECSFTGKWISMGINPRKYGEEYGFFSHKNCLASMLRAKWNIKHGALVLVLIFLISVINDIKFYLVS